VGASRLRVKACGSYIYYLQLHKRTLNSATAVYLVWSVSLPPYVQMFLNCSVSVTDALCHLCCRELTHDSDEV